MKRIGLLLALLATFACQALAQKFASDAIFDGRYNNNPSTSVAIHRTGSQTFRRIEVKGNARIVAELEKAARKDAEKCVSVSEFFENGSYRLLLNYNGTNICFEKKSKDNGSLWINSPSDGSGTRTHTVTTITRNGNSSSVSSSTSTSSKSKKNKRRSKTDKRKNPQVYINGEPLAEFISSVCTSVSDAAACAADEIVIENFTPEE